MFESRKRLIALLREKNDTIVTYQNELHSLKEELRVTRLRLADEYRRMRELQDKYYASLEAYLELKEKMPEKSE